MVMSETTRQVLRLLAQSRPQEASAMAVEARDALEERIREARLEIELLSELAASIPVEDPSQPPVGPATKAEMRLAVLSSAQVVARDASSRATTDSVERYMKAQGLQTPAKTAIGLILNHSPEWTRLDRGVYEWVGVAQVDGHEENHGEQEALMPEPE